ncbi:LamG domain-containing protein [Candidatus Poribacteria bacterium]|nr:LamG domain-containing protein [Candidatus Poribacteria bacterium]
MVKMLLVMVIVVGLSMILIHKAISDVVGIWLLDEGKGKVAKDFSGRGNDGNLTGTVKWSPSGKIGACIEGDGTVGWVEIPSSKTLTRGEGPFTIMAWVKRKAAGWYGVFTKSADNPQHQDWGMYVNEGKIDFRGNWPEAWRTIGIGKEVAKVGEWAHFAVSWDQKKVSFYFNGELDSEFDWLGPFKDTDAALAIAADPAGGDEPLNGFVDEVGMFDEALEKNEIQRAMKGLENFLPVESSGRVSTTWGEIKAYR